MGSASRRRGAAPAAAMQLLLQSKPMRARRTPTTYPDDVLDGDRPVVAQVHGCSVAGGNLHLLKLLNAHAFGAVHVVDAHLWHLLVFITGKDKR